MYICGRRRAGALSLNDYVSRTGKASRHTGKASR